MDMWNIWADLLQTQKTWQHQWDSDARRLIIPALSSDFSPVGWFIKAFSISASLSLYRMVNGNHSFAHFLQFYVSVVVMAAQSVATVALVPPPRLPDLFPVLVSATAFLHFLGTFVYFNIVQFSAPPGKKSQKKMNWLVPRSVIHPRCFAIFVSRRNTVKRVFAPNAGESSTLFCSTVRTIELLTERLYKPWTDEDWLMKNAGMLRHFGF